MRTRNEDTSHIDCPLRLKFWTSLCILSKLLYRGEAVGSLVGIGSDESFQNTMTNESTYD